MVTMPDNWSLGRRQISFTGTGRGRGERVMEQKDRYINHKTEAGKDRERLTDGENEDCLNDRKKWM